MRRASFPALIMALAALLVATAALLESRQPPAPARITATLAPSACEAEVRGAVIGDFGDSVQSTADVAALVARWRPDFVATVGDNNYPAGGADTIDDHIGRYYAAFIAPYRGEYGAGAAENRFFPALGNHDWDTERAGPHLDYFTLPGNERYYEVVRGPLHLFVLDSDSREPDGIGVYSAQAAWLEAALAQSETPWQLVILHHPPYTSGTRGAIEAVRWPFAACGADAVLSGHDHFYERLSADGIPYLINGAGGQSLYAFGTPVPESLIRFNRDFGALRIDAGADCLLFRFVTRIGTVIDEVALSHP